MGILNGYGMFEANQTAYFVSEYITSISLGEYLQNKGGKMAFEGVRALLIPVIELLSEMHQKGIFHLCINPDTILITSNNRINLKSTESSQVQQGFASKEQYLTDGKQGPWTDVYALGATAYYMLTGTVPQPASERLKMDQLNPLTAFSLGISQQVDAVIRRALAVEEVNRYQTMNEFKEKLLHPESQEVFQVNQSNNIQMNQPVQPVSVQYQQPMQPGEMQYQQPMAQVQMQHLEPPKKKKGGKVAIIFIIMLMLVIGGGGATYLLMPTIPDLAGELEDEAIELLKDEGFSKSNYEIEYEYDKGSEKGEVIDQSPEGGTKTFERAIVITVSMGPESFELEDVVGLAQKDATALLEKANLEAIVEEIYSEEPVGNVIKMVPESGETVKAEDEISITVSMGPDPSAIIFTDDAFKMAIVEYLGLGIDAKTQPITKDMVKDVIVLEISDKGINSIDGIEAFEALETLDISYNDIDSIDVSKNLKLAELKANSCELVKFPTLPADIEILDLSDNKIQDISDLKNYPQLGLVFLMYNEIEDFSILDSMDLEALTVMTEGNIGTYGDEIIPTINDSSSIQSSNEINDSILSVFPDSHSAYSSVIGSSAAELLDLFSPSISLEDKEADDPLNIDEYYFSADDISGFLDVDNTLDKCVNFSLFCDEDRPIFEGDIIISITENNTLLDVVNILGTPSQYFGDSTMSYMIYYTTDVVYDIVFEDNTVSFLMVFSNDDYFN